MRLPSVATDGLHLAWLETAPANDTGARIAKGYRTLMDPLGELGSAQPGLIVFPLGGGPKLRTSAVVTPTRLETFLEGVAVGDELWARYELSTDGEKTGGLARIALQALTVE